MPFTVEVEGPLPRTDYASTCACTEVYRITADSVWWLKINTLLRDKLQNRPVVCLCMGEFGGQEVEFKPRGHRSHYRKRRMPEVPDDNER